MHRTVIEKMTKRSALIMAFTLLMVFSAACNKNSNNSNSSTSNNANSTSSNNKNSSSSSTANTSSTSISTGDDTPTGALKSYYDAAKRKDVQTAKKYLSHGTLQMIEGIAKSQNKSVDELLQQGADQDAQIATPEFSNEQINGDTATVEIKTPDKPTVTAQMVKEDGIWKLAIDKMMPGGGK